MDLAPGTRIDRYVLLEPLGQGGQGAVWKAEDPLHPERPCALKLVELRRARPADAERVRREARALARLEHPSLVRCFGLFEDLKRDLLGLALELVDGTSLRRAKSDPRLGTQERAALLCHVAHALAYVHDQGVVHRDLKPENVLVSDAFFDNPGEPSTVKLLDFGIAAEEGNPQPLTALDTVVGTLAFLAPEVVDPSFFKAKGSTPAVDVFAFGVLAWQLLTDSPHPTGLVRASLVEYGVAYRRAAEQSSEWPTPRPEGAWGELLGRCLAVVADQRIQNGTELSTSCDLAARSSAIVRPEPAPGSLPGSVPTAVASPDAMVGRTAVEAAPAAPPSQAPTEQLGGAEKKPSARPVPASTVREAAAARPAPPTPAPRTNEHKKGRSRALPLAFGLLVLAGAAAAVAVLHDLGLVGEGPVPTATAHALPTATAHALPPAPPPSASAPAAAASVAPAWPLFSPTSALPVNCDHDAGICACCPSGRDCSPGTCDDDLGIDQSWLLRAGPIRSDNGDLTGAEVCVQVKGLGTTRCTGPAADGGQPVRIHVDTSDLLDRGIRVEVRAGGHSARTSFKSYSDGLKRKILCTGLLITGFEGDLQVNSLKLFLDPDGATKPAVNCPDRLVGSPAPGQ